jgi:hypothetical protein
MLLSLYEDCDRASADERQTGLPDASAAMPRPQASRRRGRRRLLIFRLGLYIREMIILLRAVLVCVLAVAAVAPLYAGAAPAGAGHGAAAGHHPVGSGAPDPIWFGSQACCASASMQRGAAALVGGQDWVAAERLANAVSREPEGHASRGGPLPEFEPPPPRI